MQSASETVAIKALAYGIEPYRVDGNDVFAVYEATRRAAERARGGEGVTFIEALTYRVSAHSSSDDPSRYRDETVTADWKTRKDPIQRARTFLLARGWLDERGDDALGEAIEAEVRDAIASEEAAPLPAPATMLSDVYEEMPWHLREQLKGLSHG